MTPNHAYEDWHHVDLLLVGWLCNAMTQKVGTRLMHCQTAKALWDVTLTLTCVSLKSRIMVFKVELNQIRKQGMEMEE